MGKNGPVPREGSVTRHKPAQRSRQMEAPTPEIPELVGTYLKQTEAWWLAWVDSPQTAFFTATDWQTLLRLVPLVDLYFGAPTAQLASEIRQTEAKLGATAADRDRLGWKIDPPAPVVEGEPAPTGSRARKDPRAKADA